MKSEELRALCWGKYNSLLDQYFGGIHEETAAREGTLDGRFTNELPEKVAGEFRSYIEDVWKEVAPDGAEPFDKIMDADKAIKATKAEYLDYLTKARNEAQAVSLWEKITSSNHEDVTYYKGLLKQYTEELMRVMLLDFTKEAGLILDKQAQE